MPKFAQCSFESSPDKMYTYEVPKGLSETVEVNDIVIVQANGGTYRFPFTLVKVRVLSDTKPRAARGVLLKKIVAAPHCLAHKKEEPSLSEDEIV